MNGAAEDDGRAWKGSLPLLVEGMQSLLAGAGEGGEVEREVVERGLRRVLWGWRQPHLLLALPDVLFSDPAAHDLALAFLR